MENTVDQNALELSFAFVEALKNRGVADSECFVQQLEDLPSLDKDFTKRALYTLKNLSTTEIAASYDHAVPVIHVAETLARAYQKTFGREALQIMLPPAKTGIDRILQNYGCMTLASAYGVRTPS